MLNYKHIYNQDYFNGKNSCFWIGGYGQNWGFANRYFNNIYNSFIAYIDQSPKSKVLDVGCAYGFILERFPGNFAKYGLDVSGHAVEIAKKRLPNASIRTADVQEKFPFSQNFFDYVICNDVLEHLEEPGKTLINIYHVLKKDGLFFLTLPNLNLIRKLLLFYPDKLEHHISLKPFHKVYNLLLNSGFKVVNRWTFINPAFYLRLPGFLGIESAFVCKK